MTHDPTGGAPLTQGPAPRKDRKVVSLPVTLALGLALSGCAPVSQDARGPVCSVPGCRVAVVAGPGDGSYVPGGLEAAAGVFLTPTNAGTAPVGGGVAGGLGVGGPRLRIDRDTLSPGKGTSYRVTRNHGLGIRAAAERRLVGGLHGYGAVSVGVVLQDYALPRGLGPLTDPISVTFRNLYVTPEIGLQYDVSLPALPGVTARLAAGTGLVLSQTRTRLQSALLDVRSTHTDSQPFVSLGAGLVLDRPGAGRLELMTGGRLGKGGDAVMRSEIRLSR